MEFYSIEKSSLQRASLKLKAIHHNVLLSEVLFYEHQFVIEMQFS